MTTTPTFRLSEWLARHGFTDSGVAAGPAIAHLFVMPEPVRIVGDGRPYIGKRLLVGVTYETAGGEFLSQEQFHGVIVEAGEGEVVLERADTGERISLPPMLQEAEPGEYRLRSTGEVVVDPDYFARFTWRKESGEQNEGSA